MYSPLQPHPRWWRGRASVVALVLATVVISAAGGVAIGRASEGSRSPRREPVDATLPAVSKGTLSTPHGPTAMQDELPVGFSDDKAGALSCAGVAGEALIDYVQIRRATSPQTWITTYTTGTLSAASLQRIFDWDPKLYQRPTSYRPTELPAARHAVAVSELAPVGYKILSFSAAAAHVQVWFHGVGWSQGSSFPNAVVNRSADVELVWRSGDWKITSFTDPPGQEWEGPGLDDPAARGFVPWPGGQFTFVTG